MEQNIIDNDKNIKILHGGKVVVISPLNNDKIIIPFFCPTCEYPMKQAEDAESYRNHTCCHMCELNWASSNETPDKSSERWKLYMERRHLVFLPQINFK